MQQTLYNVQPGDHAKIIDSDDGPRGASVGRIVLVHNDMPTQEEDKSMGEVLAANPTFPDMELPPSRYDKPHSRYGKIWPVTAIDGKPFMTRHGDMRSYADVPDRWLQKIVPPPPILKKKEKEIA